MKEKFIPALDFPILTTVFDLFLTLAVPERKIKCELIDFMRIKENEKVLDFGCGTGNLLILGKQKYPMADFEGIDIDPKVLGISRKKIERKKLKISLVEYDGGTLPQNNNSFEKVMSSLMMHHLSTDKKIKAMQEILRILKESGQFYLSDFGIQKNPIFAVIGKLASNFQQEVEANFKGLLPEIMCSAGFKNVQTLKIYNTRLGTIYTYSGEKDKTRKVN